MGIGNPGDLALGKKQTTIGDAGLSAQGSKADKAFIARLKGQEHAAFRELVGQYHRKLLALAGAVAGPQWAEEVVQEAWVSIYKALPRFEARSSLETWLYTIVRNESFTRLRRESRNVEPASLTSAEQRDGFEELLHRLFQEDGSWRRPLAEWGLDSPDEMLEEEELRQCIEHTLGLLSADQKAVFVLRDLEQASLEDICNILELSNSNVRVLLHRARLRLLQVIEHYQETGQC